MLSIILLRLQRLKGEYYVFLIMTFLSLLFTFIFGASMKYDNTPVVLVVDQDSSSYSEKIIDELKDNDTFRYQLSNYEDAVSKVKSDKVLAALVIGQDFGKNIEENVEPKVGVIKTQDDFDVQSFERITESVINKMIGNIKLAEATANFISQEKEVDKTEVFNLAYSKAVESWKYRKPIHVNTSTLEIDSDTEYDPTIHSIIGFSLFFSMYTIVFAIGEILNERKYKTWGRLLVSPISKSSILGGNLVVTYLMGFVQVGVLFIAGKYLFGINLGSSLLGVLMILVAFVFAITSIGLFLSGIVKTHSQLSAMTPIVLTSTSMLGGCMWPLEIVNNKIILAIANITPQKWAIEGLESMAMYGNDFNGAVIPTIVLLGMGLVFFTFGVRLVKFE